ncbi:hypothetical protein C8Q75DRAFT_786395 [Abortiporus biennis]|nr:hypothetical protein C8Q75DRAFT_786395 [Abortiporus biennis]
MKFTFFLPALLFLGSVVALPTQSVSEKRSHESSLDTRAAQLETRVVVPLSVILEARDFQKPSEFAPRSLEESLEAHDVKDRPVENPNRPHPDANKSLDPDPSTISRRPHVEPASGKPTWDSDKEKWTILDQPRPYGHKRRELEERDIEELIEREFFEDLEARVFGERPEHKPNGPRHNPERPINPGPSTLTRQPRVKRPPTWKDKGKWPVGRFRPYGG